jgi:hypothetical protein
MTHACEFCQKPTADQNRGSAIYFLPRTCCVARFKQDSDLLYGMRDKCQTEPSHYWRDIHECGVMIRTLIEVASKLEGPQKVWTERAAARLVVEINQHHFWSLTCEDRAERWLAADSELQKLRQPAAH